jgi:diguanylate cyclase (GGDEF)-like protein
VGAGALAEFLAGLRRVDPGVRVLRVARNGDAAPVGYDGQVEPTTDAPGLRRCIGAGVASRPPACETIEPKPAPVGAPAQTGPGEPAPAAVAAPAPGGELELLRLLTLGEPVLDAALAQARSRAGCADIEFVGVGGAPTDRGAYSSAPVRIAGEIVGEVRSGAMPPAALSPVGAWLGAWLELEAKQAALREAAFRDPLTGAWNRRYFDEFLPEVIRAARVDRRALTVLFFDIDDFKSFNDKHGHAAGDEILTECVRLLNTAVRPTDKVCRIGGDEFAVVFHEPQGPREPDSRHPTSVFDIAERFRSLVCEARFHKLGDDAPGKLTISGGLATYPWDGRTAEELIERADQLALEGKKQGKNVIAIGPGCRRMEAEG